MNLSPDLQDFIRALNNNDVKYLVVGGYAVAFHGHPRYTKDLDVWVWAERDNAKRMMKALDEFGFKSADLSEDDFVKPDHIIQLGYPPNRIDMITELLGVDFESCYAARVQTIVDGIEVSMIDAENLKKNKKATARPQDLADADNLEK